MPTLPEPLDTLPIKILQGADFSLNVTANNPPGTPWDISTGTISGKIRDTFGGNVLATFVVTAINLVAGQFNISLTNATTAALTTTFATGQSREATLGVYDLELTMGGKIYRLLQGTVTLSREAGP